FLIFSEIKLKPPSAQLLHGIGIEPLNFLCGGTQAVKRLQPGEFGAGALQFSKRNLRRNVANQRVLREGATTKSTQRGIEATATGVESGGDLGWCVVG